MKKNEDYHDQNKALLQQMELKMKSTLVILFLCVLQISVSVYSKAASLSSDLKDDQIFDLRQVSGNQGSCSSISENELNNAESMFFSENVMLSTHENCTTSVDEEKPVQVRSVQQHTVSGTVTDENSEPLPGVNIKIEGTTIGTMTDANGNYSINLPNRNAVLVFSFIGYTSTSVPVSGKTVINVSLKQNVNSLDEVVIVGYGTQKKVNLTGAVDQISSKAINNISVPNFTRAMEGIIPNLNITISSGRPTDNPTYNIRGLTSIGAGGTALILIDGVEGDPQSLNPNDVESVSVLKDAASAAIYGARGAFGVVLITTKSPQKGKPTVNYSTAYSANYRTVKRDMVTDSYTWAKMYNEGYSGWYDYTRPPTSIGDAGIRFSQDYLEALKYRSEHPGELPEVDIDPATGEYVYYGNTDWYKELFASNVPSMEHSLQVSGGSDIIDYNLSGLFYSQDGIYRIRSDKYNKYNLRFKGSIKITDWLKLTNNMEYASSKYSDPFAGFDIWTEMNTYGLSCPMTVMYNPDGTFTQAASLGVGRLYGESYSISNTDQITTSLGFDMSVIKNVLNIKGDFSYKNISTNTDKKSVPVPYSIKPGQIIAGSSNSLSNSKGNSDYYAFNVYADFAHSFGQHNFKILVGNNIEIYNYRSLAVSRNGLINEGLSVFNTVTGSVFSITGTGSEWSTTGLFSRLNYDYKQKYLVEINARYDGSSKFPVTERFGIFPSVSVGWRLSEESFIKDITSKWLDNLKVRASYGSLGNGAINPYLFVEQIKTTQSGRIINGSLPYYTTNPAVLPDNFTWETSTTLDFGGDIDLFKNKFSGSFDWYKRTTTDMITNGPTLPVVFGATVPQGNYADLETKGFELSLKWTDQIKTSKPIFYGIRLTLGDNQSYITKYNNPTKQLNISTSYFTTGYYEGMCVGEIWGYTTEGFFTSYEDIAQHANQSAVESSALRILNPGDIKFKDLNNDGYINKGLRTVADHGDLSIIGNTTPRYNYGITLDCSWNNFSVSAFFQGIGKRDWYPPYACTQFWGQYTVWYGCIPQHTLDNAYTIDNPDLNAYFPRYKGPSPYGDRGLQAQTKYLQDASYIRLKNLTVSYSLPKTIIEKIKLKDLKFYFTGLNIWTYTPIYKITRDVDPEQIVIGRGDYYPMLKTFTFGVNLSF